jgi:CRP-like cAMP-binding protein/rubredoxin
MPKWQCVECGYFVQEANRPPDVCPSCSLRCSFTDVTCYRPECGGPVNPDPAVMKTITSKGVTAPLRPSLMAKEEAPEEEIVYGEKARMATLFHGLSDKEIQQILSIGEPMVCEPGTVLFRAEDEATTIYFIESGRVAIRVKEGKTEKTVYTASQGDVLGWSTVVLPYQRTATAVVVERAKVIAIDTNKFQNFCDKNAAMCYRVAQNVNRAVIARLRFAKAAGVEEVYG